MSVDFYFHCIKCKETGGGFTHQAWGCGNADIIDTFKFLFAHSISCDLSDIQIISEHSGILEDDWDDDRCIHLTEEKWKQHRKQHDDDFPCSDDWEFMRIYKGKRNELSRLWRFKQGDKS